MSALDLAWTKAASLFFLTFFSEDAATLGGATLAAAGQLATPLGLAACFLGIWLGDLGLYAAARHFGRPFLARQWVRKRVSEDRLARSEAWWKKRGLMVLLVARFVPGLRLPTYLLAGTLAVPFLSFAVITALMGLIWVPLVFALVWFAGAQTMAWYAAAKGTLGVAVVLVLLLAALIFVSRGRIGLLMRGPAMQRWLQWEFWPARLFYIPIGLNYAWLALKYRGINLPTIANPGMLTGGIVGESKDEILRDLFQTSPQFTARAALIGRGSVQERMARFDLLCAENGLSLPVVLKPNVAQRGSGFRLARTETDARDYLAQVTGDVVLQEYAAGPGEAGIFYYRFPHEERGRIFAITEKVFPAIIGDGIRTVEELIRADARAAIMAATYLQRHRAIRAKVLGQGERLKLVEAGNHCQGCIFRDGMHLWTEALETRIDQISRQVPGFYIGRYDVRFPTDQDLMRGENFKILELNGAASEATSIYDARNSIFQAYATLFRQWDLVFAIGAANRKLGHRPAALAVLREEWKKYQQLSACYPLAD
ncbi:MAG TPA: VTT domain-containing protein [Rhizomicrobium sp.]|jgi:membrane protein DedA with SNARE-associated domain